MRKVMSFISLLCFFIVTSSFSVQSLETRQPDNGMDDLEVFVDGVMAAHMRSNHIVGATFSFVQNGEVILAKGYGYADFDKMIPVSAEKTLFRPGSISKLFTWTAVMQLVERGKIDLNTDINTYLKDFQIPDTYPEPVTMKDLMTHTPGFEESGSPLGVREPEELAPLGKYLAGNIPARIFPPGTITAYSNYGTALAGYIVEIISGIPFEDYIEQHIFQPLGMTQSTFCQPLPSELAGDMSVGYKIVDGAYERGDFELINGMAPAGSLSSSALDMAKFMIAYLRQGEYKGRRILEEETAKRMQTQLFTHDPRLNGNAHGFWEKTYNNIDLIGHGGDTMYFHSLVVLAPGKNLGFFVSYNSVGGGGAPRTQLMQLILERYFPHVEAGSAQPLEGFKKRAKKITGTYGFTRVNTTTHMKLLKLFMNVKVSITRENTLLITSAFTEPKQWIEIAPLVYRERDGQDFLMFKKDGNSGDMFLFLNSLPYMPYVRMNGTETPGFHFFILGLSLFLLLTTLIWPFSALRRKICRIQTKQPPGPRSARLVAFMSTLICVVFMVGLVILSGDTDTFWFGPPFMLKVMLVLPLLAGVLGIGILFYTAYCWFRRSWTTCSRIHYTLVLFGLLMFLWFLNYWNLLGFKI